MLVTCPSCEASLDVAPEHYGHTVQCPACSEKLAIEAPQQDKQTTKSGKPERLGWAEKDHANADFLKSLGIGAVATVLFLALMFPFLGTRLGDIFLDRGWVNYAETFLFFWGLAMLLLKVRKNRRQERAAILSLFPAHLGKEIHSGNVGAFIDNIYKIPLTLRDSIIVNRIRKALELFEIRNDNAEVAAFLETQSHLDANRSTGSYSLLRVFLWAIPILGFIGTVMGLSTAVGALDMGDASGDPEALKNAINNLTGGLGTAFDTTLLGLILSLLLNFPLAAVMKKEDETLTIIDAVCTEKLLPKLNDSKASSNEEILQQADSLPELVGSLARAHETFLENLNESTRQMRQTSEVLEGNLVQASDKLTQTSSELFLRSHTELDQTFKRIATGIDHINQALRELGKDGLPGEAKKKKGLFSK
ncbi:MotA/TolQ/ExbB proton channel family protein [Roseibacillus ishigakijimensis]|uniref:MotA/TolQ/ExbB proton channel family protein n=1 Tax=Roseibacillus ishigakijimensis TaxID=454146 RepID=A0A934RKP5_9BACT|nr:MotA/TolQ/ExbB proton channel family protein [Roseibacillus ishigakijimensis]MBK1832495.1 MotA/TolQ/ExbB proton channel family protein [Roseibacillus ishigakijimensis]